MVRSQVAYAELLAERGGQERARARALATDALVSARELGMRRIAAHAEVLRTR